MGTSPAHRSLLLGRLVVGTKRRAQGDQNEIDIVAIGRNRRFALVAEVKRQKKSFRENLFLDKVEHIRNGALAGFELIPLCLTLEDMDSDLTNRFQDATAP